MVLWEDSQTLVKQLLTTSKGLPGVSQARFAAPSEVLADNRRHCIGSVVR